MEPEPELQPEPASHQLQPQPGGQQQLTREYAVAVVERYGAAWASQDEEAITRIFSEDAQYLEHPFDPRRIYEGRAGIRDYWVRQIQGKQKDIRFTQVPEALLLDSEKRTALAKWEATFSNLQRDGKTYAPVSFVQVAMLSFDERGLITKLEEYWTARGKHGKGDGQPRDAAQANRASDRRVATRLVCSGKWLASLAALSPRHVNEAARRSSNGSDLQSTTSSSSPRSVSSRQSWRPTSPF